MNQQGQRGVLHTHSLRDAHRGREEYCTHTHYEMHMPLLSKKLCNVIFQIEFIIAC